MPEQTTSGAAAAGRGQPGVDARHATGVQIGEGNTQIVYQYSALTWGDGVAPPPLAMVSGRVESPYRGLASYEEQDAPFFFGREETATQILARLGARLDDTCGVAVVSGASGAGKSSVMRAGVLPRLRGAGLPGAPEAAGWPCLQLTPGPRPLDELVLQLGTLAGVDAAGLRATLTADPTSVVLTARQVVARHVPAPGGPASDRREPRLVLMIDQFEQVFTQVTDAAHRAGFLAALRALTTGASPPALVLLGIRADFEARCAEEGFLGPAVQDRYLVTGMTRRQLRSATTEPARLAGGSVEPGLVEVLLDELGPGSAAGPAIVGAGALPLLSYALDQAWRGRTGPELTLADYERTGGIERAVAATAQATYDRLAPAGQVLAKEVFLRLAVTDPDGRDTSMRVRRDDLLAGHPGDVAEVDAVVEAFAGERLLTLAGGTLELSHEVLLSAWPLLRDDWLAQSRADRVVVSGLDRSARDWDAHGRDPAYLFSGSVLDAALAATTAGSAGSRLVAAAPVAQEFLATSRGRRRRSARRRRSVVVGLAALASALAVVAAVAVRAQDEAQQQRDVAVGQSLVQQSEAVGDTDAGLSKLESVAAWRVAPSAVSYAAMLDAAVRPGLATLTDQARPVRAIAVSPDGATIAAAGNDGLRLWDVPRRARTASLGGDGDKLRSVAVSPDGRLVATGGSDGQVEVYTLPDHRRVVSLDAGDAVTGVAFDPTEPLLAAVSTDGALTWWDLRSQKRVRTLQLGADLWSLSYDPRGREVVAGGEDTGAVVLGSPAPGSAVRTLVPASGTAGSASASTVAGATFSPDGTMIAVTGVGGVRVVGATRGNLVAVLSVGAVTATFTPDGKYLLTGNLSGSVWVWQLRDNAEICDLTGTAGPVLDVAVLGDGRTAVSGGSDGTVRVWDLSSCLPERSVTVRRNGSEVEAAGAWTPDGRQLVTLSVGVVQLWDQGSGRLLRTFTVGSADHAALTADGGAVALTTPVGGDRYDVVLLDVRSGSRRTLFQARGEVDDVALSPDGHAVAVASTVSSGQPEPAVVVHAVDGSTTPLALGANPGAAVPALVFSPDGHSLATVGSDSSVELWDVSSGRRLDRVVVDQTAAAAGQALGAEAVAYSPDGRLLATAGDDKRIRVWSTDGSTLRLVRTFDPSPGAVLAIAFQAGGQVLATGGSFTPLQLWHVATGHPLGSARHAGTTDVRNLAFSPDGTRLAVGGAKDPVDVWDTHGLLDLPASLCRTAGVRLGRERWSAAAGQGVPYREPCP